MTVPDNHPRAESLRIREKIVEGMHKKIVAEAGLIAHGRGEALDYLIGEKTANYALKQERVAVSLLLTAEKPVISINGNVAALCPNEIVEFSKVIGCPLEINLFYRCQEREKVIYNVLINSGAEEILGLDKKYQTEIPELSHLRRIVDKRGIFSADVVLVPLEDGDRTMALRKMGKKVISIDLNPLSRTSLWSNVTIVNNVIRAIPEMVKIGKELKEKSKKDLLKIFQNFDNDTSLQETIKFISNRLVKIANSKLDDSLKIKDKGD